jgi:hypothetical protein
MVQNIGQEVREHPHDFSPLRWGVNFTTTHVIGCLFLAVFLCRGEPPVSMCGGRVCGTILDYPVSFLINPLSFLPAGAWQPAPHGVVVSGGGVPYVLAPADAASSDQTAAFAAARYVSQTVPGLGFYSDWRHWKPQLTRLTTPQAPPGGHGAAKTKIKTNN